MTSPTPDETPQGDLQRRITRWLRTPISSTKPERIEGDTVALVQDAAAEIALLATNLEVMQRRYEVTDARVAELEQEREKHNQEASAALASYVEGARQIVQFRKLAKEATNGWACYARTQKEHAEIARLHTAIDLAMLPNATKEETP